MVQRPWSSGSLVLWFPGSLVSILWSLVAAFGRFQILQTTAFEASEKIGSVQNTIFVVVEMLRLLKSKDNCKCTVRGS